MPEDNNKILYRDHKESLDDSMITAIQIASKQEIINHLNDFYEDFGERVEDIKFTHQGFDKRNKWDTYMVLAKFENKEGFSLVGYTNGTLSIIEDKKERIVETLSQDHSSHIDMTKVVGVLNKDYKRTKEQQDKRIEKQTGQKLP